VKLDVEGIPDAGERAKAVESLTKRLAKIGCTPATDGTITLFAKAHEPQKQKLRFLGSGEYEMTEWLMSLEFVHEGERVWGKEASNVRRARSTVIILERGENIGTWLAKREKPDYGLFEEVELPRLLQSPAANGRSTLGTSQVTGKDLR
jgi:hypothetical protein